jgi:hypothetical protein
LRICVAEATGFFSRYSAPSIAAFGLLTQVLAGNSDIKIALTRDRLTRTNRAAEVRSDSIVFADVFLLASSKQTFNKNSDSPEALAKYELTESYLTIFRQ